MDKIAEHHPARRQWKEYEDLARERPKPLAASSFHSPEPTFFEQLCEWIARHWFLYLLMLSVGLSLLFLLFDAMRGRR